MNFMTLFKHDINFIKNYLLSSNARFSSFIESIYQYRNIEKITQLFSDKRIQNRLKTFDSKIPDNRIIKTFLPINVLNIILNDNYFKSRFLSLEIEDINNLVSNGLVIPFFYTNDDAFINKYLEVAGIQQRRFYINNLVNNNYSIYELLNNKIHDLDDGEVNKFLNEFDKLLSISDSKAIKKIFSKKILELLIDRYFGDFVYNIIVNMKQVVEFNQKINNKIIDKERLYWYNLLLNFDSHFITDQIKIYQSISKEIYVWLYEDFRKCQNYAYDLFNQSVTNFNKSKKRFENGINIYELNGEDFIIPVHATAFSKNDNNFIWN